MECQKCRTTEEATTGDLDAIQVAVFELGRELGQAAGDVLMAGMAKPGPDRTFTTVVELILHAEAKVRAVSDRLREAIRPIPKNLVEAWQANLEAAAPKRRKRRKAGA